MAPNEHVDKLAGEASIPHTTESKTKVSFATRKAEQRKSLLNEWRKQINNPKNASRHSFWKPRDMKEADYKNDGGSTSLFT